MLLDLRRHLAASSLAFVILAPACPSASGQVPIDFGRACVAGDLPAGALRAYSFTASAGDVVLVRVGRSAGDFWPSIQLLDPTGKEVGQAVRDFPAVERIDLLPVSGTYGVLVSDGLKSARSGTFFVQAQRLNQPGNATPILADRPLAGKLSCAGGIASFSFIGCEGDTVALGAALTAGDFTPNLRLFDPAGSLVAGDENYPAAHVVASLKRKGLYTVILTSPPSRSGTGDYTASLSFPVKGSCDQIADVRLDGPAVTGCKPASGEVVLAAPAATGGIEVALAATGPILVPQYLTFAAGSDRVPFSLTTQPVSEPSVATISARVGSEERRATLVVLPIGIASVTLDRDTIRGGETLSARALLGCAAAPGEIVVTLSSSNPEVAAPMERSLIIPRDRSSSEAFTVVTRTVKERSPVTIYATANGTTQGFVLFVTP